MRAAILLACFAAALAVPEHSASQSSSASTNDSKKYGNADQGAQYNNYNVGHNQQGAHQNSHYGAHSKSQYGKQEHEKSKDHYALYKAGDSAHGANYYQDGSNKYGDHNNKYGASYGDQHSGYGDKNSYHDANSYSGGYSPSSYSNSYGDNAAYKHQDSSYGNQYGANGAYNGAADYHQGGNHYDKDNYVHYEVRDKDHEKASREYASNEHNNYGSQNSGYYGNHDYKSGQQGAHYAQNQYGAEQHGKHFNQHSNVHSAPAFRENY